MNKSCYHQWVSIVLYSIMGVSLSDDDRRCDGVCNTSSVLVRDAYRRPCQPQRGSHEDRERQVQASPYSDSLLPGCPRQM